MAEYAPALVGMYSRASGNPERVAEFRFDSSSGVTVSVIDAEWGNLAKVFYNEGIRLVSEKRTVYPGDGGDFMRALIARAHMGYYGFVDETDPG